MKVLMFGWEFPPFHNGGLGTACQGLTGGLDRHGVEVTFVLPKKIAVDSPFIKFVYGDDNTVIKKKYFVNSILQGYVTSESYEERLKDVEGKKTIYGKTLYEEVLRYGAVGEEIAKKEDFDVIHAHDWLTAKAGIAAKKATGKPFVLHVHATEFDRSGDNVNQHVYDIEREGMEEADMIVAVSNWTKNKIIKHYGISPEKIKVVHNGVEFEDYILNQVNDMKMDKKIVLSIGRITFQKGIDYFVRAARKVLDFYPDALFVLAGSGDLDKQMINMVAEMGMADKFIFPGFLRGADYAKAFKMAHLFVMLFCF